MTRKEAREEVFFLTFEKIFSKDSPEDILKLAIEVRDLLPDDYVEETFYGICRQQEAIDQLITDKAVGWKINRISKTALAVLRLATYEILYVDSIPDSVSANEAVELCKKYATQEDGSFVNGILGSIVKSKAHSEL
ncbi:MAG: transcription antitermination factor NusB [Clostridia bacterium]|nr:transcription antitermination factor NusB [Clostridia bacterium]